MSLVTHIAAISTKEEIIPLWDESERLRIQGCETINDLRDALRTIREESAKIFSATAGLPDCGLIYKVAAAALANDQALAQPRRKETL